MKKRTITLLTGLAVAGSIAASTPAQACDGDKDPNFKNNYFELITIASKDSDKKEEGSCSEEGCGENSCGN